MHRASRLVVEGCGEEGGVAPPKEESGGIWSNIFGGGREEKSDEVPVMPKFKEELE